MFENLVLPPPEWAKTASAAEEAWGQRASTNSIRGSVTSEVQATSVQTLRGVVAGGFVKDDVGTSSEALACVENAS